MLRILILLLGVNTLRTRKDKTRVFNEAMGEKIFPMQTIQSMAERWGVHRNVVTNWAMRDAHFPQALSGVITPTSRTPRVYALNDVERYEKLKGLGK